MTDYCDPDLMLITETKLDSSIFSSELLPKGYMGEFRRDHNLNGGGVMIVTKDCYTITDKLLIRKKGRRFKKAKKSEMDEDRPRYLDIEQMVKRELGGAERVYVNGILQNGLESENNKPFWKYVKSPKQETFGISALISNDNVITDSLSKAEILNSQFKSVFTPQSGNTFPQLPGT